MYVIGLTGGIAAGKTMISKELENLGAYLVDSDCIAREVAAPGSQACQDIARVFGENYLDERGGLRRKELGDLVFGDKKKLAQLNAITHPLIRLEIEARLGQAAAQGQPAVLLDAPLLFEAGLEDLCDEVWLVDVTEDRQQRRLMERDGIGEKAARARLQSQLPTAKKRELADVLIDNNGTPEAARTAARRLWQQRLAEVCKSHGK